MTEDKELIVSRREFLRPILGDFTVQRSDAGFGELPSRVDESEYAIWAVTDLTLLKPEASKDQIAALCEKAVSLRVATVCVNGIHLARVARLLDGSGIPAIAVVGFPLGAMTAKSTATEALRAVEDGAAEIDMVFPVGLLKGGDFEEALAHVVEVVSAASVPVKVILETSLLDRHEIVDASIISAIAGAAFVKTSTGFGAAGATVENVSLMRRTVGNRIGVKASGGIRTFPDAVRMLRAGASRIGASGLA